MKVMWHIHTSSFSLLLILRPTCFFLCRSLFKLSEVPQVCMLHLHKNFASSPCRSSLVYAVSVAITALIQGGGHTHTHTCGWISRVRKKYMFKYWIYKTLWVYKSLYRRLSEVTKMCACVVLSYLPCLYVARWAWLCMPVCLLMRLSSGAEPCSGATRHGGEPSSFHWIVLDQDSWWPMPFRLRRSTISLGGGQLPGFGPLVFSSGLWNLVGIMTHRLLWTFLHVHHP